MIRQPGEGTFYLDSQGEVVYPVMNTLNQPNYLFPENDSIAELV